MKNNGVPILALILLILSCCEINGNYFGVSDSSAASKKSGFLVRNLEPDNSIIHLDSIGDLHIKEVFVEKVWRSNSDLSKSATLDHQLVLCFSDSLPSNYSFDWEMQIGGGRKLSYHDKFKLTTEISDWELQDSISIEIYVGDVFYRDKDLKPAHTITFN